jgi:hypothetical protein
MALILGFWGTQWYLLDGLDGWLFSQGFEEDTSTRQGTPTRDSAGFAWA